VSFKPEIQLARICDVLLSLATSAQSWRQIAGPGHALRQPLPANRDRNFRDPSGIHRRTGLQLIIPHYLLSQLRIR
jgi:hypothetical protein